MKKIFDTAVLELISFESADIITTSNANPFPGEDDSLI